MSSLFILLSIAAGTAIGAAFSRRGFRREKYFREAIGFVERLSSDIAFTREPLRSVVGGYADGCAEMRKNLEEYASYLDGGAEEFSAGVLKNGEAQTVKKILYGLGKVDFETQLNELERGKAELERIYSEICVKNKGFGRAYIKLGFLGGALIGILML